MNKSRVELCAQEFLDCVRLHKKSQEDLENARMSLTNAQEREAEANSRLQNVKLKLIEELT